MSTDSIISLETLVEIGFSQGKAEQLWQQWSAWPEGPPRRETDPYDGGLQMTFDDFFIANLERDDEDVWGDDETKWRSSLSLYGINSDTQDAIMDPNFKRLRLTQSARFWAKDTVEMRYAWLQREDKMMTLVPPQICTTLDSDQSHDNFLRAIDDGTSQHVALFKVADLGRAHQLIDQNGAFDSIADLRSPCPSDFSGYSSSFYFTPHLDEAKLEGAYAKRRASCSTIALIQITIPADQIDNLSQEEKLSVHWPNPIWKQIIWLSRRGKVLSGDLRNYRSATIIIGTKAQLPDTAYREMVSPEDVTEASVYLVGGKGESASAAVQYMFSACEGEELLRDCGSFKIVSYF